MNLIKTIISSALLIVLISVPACTRDVNSELIEAAENGQTERVKSLLAAGADVNAKDNDGMTALTAAANWAHGETMRVLLDAGADANAVWEDGITALMAAALEGQPQTVKALLNAGAEVDAKNNYGSTALMTVSTDTSVQSSCSSCYTEIVQILLDAGADLEAKDNNGITPLMGAIVMLDTNIVQAFLDAGADVNAKANTGSTALILAVATSGPGPTQFSRTDNVRTLLDAGADVNAKNDYDFSALIHAEEKGHTEIAELLRKAGAHWGQEEIDFINELRQREETLQANVESAYLTVKYIVAVQLHYPATDGEGKYAKNLLRLNARLSAYEPFSVRQDGYEFKTSGQGETFTVNADPILVGETGTLHFFADESGLIRWSMEGPATIFSLPLGETEPDAE